MAKKKQKKQVKIDDNCEECVLMDEFLKALGTGFDVTEETVLSFTNDELMDLWKKLQFKENPVWVNLRNKIEAEADICLRCGKTLD